MIELKFICRISIPESLFPLLVFEFETSGADIFPIVLLDLKVKRNSINYFGQTYKFEVLWGEGENFSFIGRTFKILNKTNHFNLPARLKNQY